MFFQRDIVAEPVGVYRIERGRCARKSFQRRHSSIGIRLLGSASFESCGEKFVVGEGQLVYIPPSIAYSQRTDGEEAISVRFIEYSLPTDKIEIITPKDPAKLKELFLELQAAWSSKVPGYKSLCSSLLYQIFFMLSSDAVGEAEEDTKAHRKISDTLNYIHSHYKTDEIKVSELAKMSYMSEGGFRKIFEKCYGVSPGRYIKLLRLENSRALLESGLYSVSEAAMLSGFCDPKYFSREFSKHYGKSPRRFIKDCQ